MNNIEIIDTDMSKGAFVETKLKSLELNKTKLSEAEFINLNLNGIDFTHLKY